MEIYRDNNVRIEAEIVRTVSVCLHDLETGEEEWQDTDSYAGVKTDSKGRAYVMFYTGWEDCLYDGFYVRETEEEVRRRFKEAGSRLNDCDEYVLVRKEDKQ